MHTVTPRKYMECVTEQKKRKGKQKQSRKQNIYIH